MSLWAVLLLVAAVVTIVVCARSPRVRGRAARWLMPLSATAILLATWQIACDVTGTVIFPTPLATWSGLVALLRDGTLWQHVVASLFRVSWGFSLATLVGVPIGLWAGWSTRTFQALNPLIQGLRPISPIAWIPVGILWFGVGDLVAVFLIFLASFFPIVVGTMAAVRNIPEVHVRSAANFGVRGLDLFRRVVFPAALPQIVTSLRLALGVAWLVVVAAEMIAVNRGLGFLIIDARNMGMRYDLVVGGMIVIGLIGIVLDHAIRSLERFEQVSWGYPRRAAQ